MGNVAGKGIVDGIIERRSDFGRDFRVGSTDGGQDKRIGEEGRLMAKGAPPEVVGSIDPNIWIHDIVTAQASERTSLGRQNARSGCGSDHAA